MGDSRCQWKEYQEGWDDFKDGKKLDTNPYAFMTNKEYSWAYGWNAAKQNR